MKQPRLILASASPRRRALLTDLLKDSEVLRDSEVLKDFTVFPVDIDESVLEGEEPKGHALRLAREKAERARETFPGDLNDTFILASDTIVVIDNTILGKPADRADALRMLRALSGRTHSVITAFSLLSGEGNISRIQAVQSRVTIQTLTDSKIEQYLDAGESMDKAGAYAIQGAGAKIVEKVEGSYTCVVGLPVDEVKEALVKVGIIVIRD